MITIWVPVGLFFAAVALVVFTGRMAMERGRSGTGWIVLSVIAAVVGMFGGGIVLGQFLKVDARSLDISVGAMIGALAIYLGPFAGMGLVLAAVLRLPERVPNIG